ncbi:MAG: putative bifunctional diguanylate cyclase/phosphodiesterase, partial [Alphaproteobacteria bacterium]
VLLRLGSQLAGCPVYMVPADATAERDGGALPAYCEERRVASPGSGVIGTLRAVDIHHRPDLANLRRGMLDDLAALVGNTHQLRAMLGRVDPVSGLPNRSQFLHDLAADPRGASPACSLVMVALAEPNRYAAVVRALGHDYAEGLIRTGAGTLLDLVPSGCKLYQVSPLAFVFFCDGGRQGLERTAETLVRAFQGPITCRGIPIDTHVGIGVVAIEGDCIDGAEALRAAMAAAQDSRSTRAGWAIYDRGADAAHQRAFALLADLRRAFDGAGELSLHFQPRIAFRSGACVSAEALLRWNHPAFGPIPPGEFIPLAEATALINPLTDWVLDAAARHAVALDEAGHRFPLSVNVSPKNLAEPDFVDKLGALLARYRLAPDRLELEFTEGMLASDQSAVRHHLDRICAMGIEVAIDDFGSGYSNMSYLTQIPARILKIDQAFVRPMMESEKNQHMVRSIIAMGQGLGYRVVAEGIETADAFAMLAGWDCDEAQGYFISRPLPADGFAAWLAAGKGRFAMPA